LEVLDNKVVLRLIAEKLNALVKISVDEIKMIAIVLLTVLLWVTEDYHEYSISFITFFCARLTVAPIVGIWKWNEAGKSIDWDMILFFAGTLMISSMLIETGTVEWLSDRTIVNFTGFPYEVLLIIFILMTALIRLAFVNVLGYLTIIIPIAVSVGENLQGISQQSIIMGVFRAGVPSFLLISQSSVHLISYSYNYFSEKDILFPGMFAKVIWLIIVILFLSIHGELRHEFFQKMKWRWLLLHSFQSPVLYIGEGPAEGCFSHRKIYRLIEMK
jgi:solute carrier family 13 (sodium-dependent dicarboxylate transporter), member 2/3/5